MFGNNPIRKQDLSSPSKLWIQEVFRTIQGEGPFAGEAAVFVRLGGCNLKCYWCDTDFESSTWHPTTAELAVRIEEETHGLKNPLIVFTGGEPMRQDISKIVYILLAMNYRVQIETNGVLWIPAFDEPFYQDALLMGELSIVISPKTGKLNADCVEQAIAFKYIVSVDDADEEDGLPVMSTQVEGRAMRIARPPEGYPGEVFVQPLDTYSDLANKENERHACDLVMRHGYRLSYQMHKKLGLP